MNKKRQGKRNRAAGVRFERRVRADLESKGWIVAKWTNNVEFKEYGPGEHKSGGVGTLGRLIPAKGKFNPFKKCIMASAGFPDFIAYKLLEPISGRRIYYELIGVEVKSNGYLDKEEKEKCNWLLANHIFSKILIASKSKERGKIDYKEFKNA
jgi:hypothetical protein